MCLAVSSACLCFPWNCVTENGESHARFRGVTVQKIFIALISLRKKCTILCSASDVGLISCFSFMMFSLYFFFVILMFKHCTSTNCNTTFIFFVFSGKSEHVVSGNLLVTLMVRLLLSCCITFLITRTRQPGNFELVKIILIHSCLLCLGKSVYSSGS